MSFQYFHSPWSSQSWFPLFANMLASFRAQWKDKTLSSGRPSLGTGEGSLFHLGQHLGRSFIALITVFQHFICLFFLLLSGSSLGCKLHEAIDHCVIVCAVLQMVVIDWVDAEVTDGCMDIYRGLLWDGVDLRVTRWADKPLYLRSHSFLELPGVSHFSSFMTSRYIMNYERVSWRENPILKENHKGCPCPG